jgi:hypothetical protein
MASIGYVETDFDLILEPGQSDSIAKAAFQIVDIDTIS